LSNKKFNKGLVFAGLGSFWWGAIGVIYFKYISFIGHIEVVLHRSFWTTVVLIFTTLLFSKWKIFKKIIFNKKNIVTLFFSGILIFLNWAIWIFAISNNQIIDASFGYFIMPILSVLFGYVFLNEKINTKRLISIIFVILSVLYLLIIDFKSIPWVGLLVAICWSSYNLIRKKILVDTDIGLLLESLFALPVVMVAFYIITKNNLNDFDISNPSLMVLLMMAGPMTVIPLFLYVKGVEICGLGPTGMVFYITPTFQFILGFFLYNEEFSYQQLVSFILIWIAVFIYLKDLYENN
tara:strand:+ start:134 stop:1015 length:882 start_codon:yes stop_codon:yes gene_type:complete